MAAPTSYFRYAPAGISPGSPAHNLSIGEVVSGRVYEIPPELIPLFAADPTWKQSTKAAFENQD